MIPNNVIWPLTNLIGVAQRDLVNILIIVYDDIQRCFPDYYHIFELYCSIFHKKIFDIFFIWGNDDSLKNNEILAITMW
jgi:hypothetical protein